MPADFIINDMDTMFSDDVFGETKLSVTWFNLDDQGNTVSTHSVPYCIFDDEDVQAEMGEGVAEIVSQPTITGKENDFSTIKEDDKVTVRGQDYFVKNTEKDGTGMIEIYLYVK